MIGVSIKVGVTCPDCESTIPLNALIPSIQCSSCGRLLELSIDVWRTVLDDAIKEAPHTEEGMGSSATIFSNYKYSMVRGRHCPRYSGTKEEIEENDIFAGLSTGYVKHPMTGERTSVRKVPDIYSGELRGVVALVGEDFSLIPGDEEGASVEPVVSSEPVAFACPKCGGNLLVNGENRMESCEYCETRVYLPDDLWRILHPVKTKRTWFLLCDFGKVPFTWESEIYGAVNAGGSRICAVVRNDYGDLPIITLLNSDRTSKWSRSDIQLNCASDNHSFVFTSIPDGNLLAMHVNARDLFVLSSEDGSLVRCIKGQNAAFTMKNCRGITCMPNGEIILLQNSRESSNFQNNLLRFDLEGNPLSLWPEEKEKKIAGFLRGFFSRMAAGSPIFRAKYIKDLKDRPDKVMDSEVVLATGPDGSLYMVRNSCLAAFDQMGFKRFIIEIPCCRIYGKPAANRFGEVFLLVESDEGSMQVLKISADGQTAEVHAEGKEDNGLWESLNTLVMKPDGVIHLFGYGGRWITLTESGSGTLETATESHQLFEWMSSPPML